MNTLVAQAQCCQREGGKNGSIENIFAVADKMPFISKGKSRL